MAVDQKQGLVCGHQIAGWVRSLDKIENGQVLAHTLDQKMIGAGDQFDQSAIFPALCDQVEHQGVVGQVRRVYPVSHQPDQPAFASRPVCQELEQSQRQQPGLPSRAKNNQFVCEIIPDQRSVEINNQGFSQRVFALFAASMIPDRNIRLSAIRFEP